MHITSLLAVSLVFQRHNILHWPMMQWKVFARTVICQTYIHLPKGVVRVMVGGKVLHHFLYHASVCFHCTEKQQMIKVIMWLKDRL